MRFKGTGILLIVCLALGCFIYFYEIKGGEEREKAKEAEKRFWMIEGSSIEEIEFSPSGEMRTPEDSTISAAEGNIVAVRKSEKEWSIQSPRVLEADSNELNRLADEAAELKFQSILEETASDSSKFGLAPARSGLKIKTADNKEYTIFLGDKNPAGNRIYARTQNSDKIYLVSSSVSTDFDKKLEDLRNRSVLQFEQSEVKTINIKNSKGTVSLVKDENDLWWIGQKGGIAADSPAIRGILNALSLGKIPEFFDDDPESYINLKLDNPRIDVSLTYGEDKAIKRLSIGSTKVGLRKRGEDRNLKEMDLESASKLYLAKDASRPELFFVDQDLVDKLNKSEKELRDTAIAAFQRWDVDGIILQNTNGRISLTKEGGEWYVGDASTKGDFNAVSGILDALESDAAELIDKPGKPAVYGLDKPDVQVILKRGDTVLTDCTMGKKTETGVYAQVRGDPSVKIMTLENYGKLTGDKSEFIMKEASSGSDAETAGE